jgi:hypothetical protein
VSYDDMPLVVLPATNSEWGRMPGHEAAAQLSSNGRHVVAVGSEHWIQLGRLELAVTAIRDVCEAVRRRSRAPRCLVGVNLGRVHCAAAERWRETPERARRFPTDAGAALPDRAVSVPSPERAFPPSADKLLGGPAGHGSRVVQVTGTIS